MTIRRRLLCVLTSVCLILTACAETTLRDSEALEDDAAVPQFEPGDRPDPRDRAADDDDAPGTAGDPAADGPGEDDDGPQVDADEPEATEGSAESVSETTNTTAEDGTAPGDDELAMVAPEPGTAGPSCALDELVFDWPMPGQDARDWVINNYVDLDTSEGSKEDYTGNRNSAARTYDNHRGIDIDVPNFRAMDEDFPIYASAGGVVEDLREDQFDRNMSCTSRTWNVVRIRHDNGFLSMYGHLKRDSVVVERGDRVEAGDLLGVVGSSGCSTAAHLHFEVRGCENEVVDPFLEGMWSDPPVYITPLGFMDIVLQEGAIADVAELKDPVPNITTIAPGAQLGIGMSMGGGESGDEYSVTLRRPDGTQHSRWTRRFTRYYRHSYWWRTETLSNDVGQWLAEVRLNGVVADRIPFEVTSVDDSGAFQQVRHHVPAGGYQAVFEDVTSAGYRPVWIDGYEVDGDVFYNVVFEQTDGVAWWAYHGLDGAAYQAAFDGRLEAGYRLAFVDSYPDGDTIRYAAVFERRAGPAWRTYHGLGVAQHQARFDRWVEEGYRPLIISPVVVGDTTTVTALYQRTSAGGSFSSWSGLDSGAYQAKFAEQTSATGANRRLTYLNAYNDADGQPRFSAIWEDVSYGGWVARHNQTTAGFQGTFEAWAQAPRYYRTRLVTGYDSGNGSARFAGLWTAE